MSNPQSCCKALWRNSMPHQVPRPPKLDWSRAMYHVANLKFKVVLNGIQNWFQFECIQCTYSSWSVFPRFQNIIRNSISLSKISDILWKHVLQMQRQPLAVRSSNFSRHLPFSTCLNSTPNGMTKDYKWNKLWTESTQTLKPMHASYDFLSICICKELASSVVIVWSFSE